MSTSDCSLVELLRAHPELPPFRQLDSWRCNNKSHFAEKWREAGKAKAHFLVGKALDLQKSSATRKTRTWSGSASISCAGQPPSSIQPLTQINPSLLNKRTTVNVGISLSNLNVSSELRAKLY